MLDSSTVYSLLFSCRKRTIAASFRSNAIVIVVFKHGQSVCEAVLVVPGVEATQFEYEDLFIRTIETIRKGCKGDFWAFLTVTKKGPRQLLLPQFPYTIRNGLRPCVHMNKTPAPYLSSAKVSQ